MQTAHAAICQKQKPNNKIKKWAEYLNTHPSKEDMQMATKYMQRCSISPIIRELQIKTTLRYHLTPVRMTIIKKPTNKKCWIGCKEKGTPYTVGVNVNLHYYGEQFVGSFRN